MHSLLDITKGLCANFLNPSIPAALHCVQQPGGGSLQLLSSCCLKIMFLRV